MSTAEIVLNTGLVALLAAGTILLAKAGLTAWRKAKAPQPIDQRLSIWAWWVEVSTRMPQCTYYFGPFDSEAEAQTHQGDYVQDLEQEGAQEISAQVKWCKPQELTVCALNPEMAPMAS